MMFLELANATHSDKDLVKNLSTVLIQATQSRVKADFNMASLDVLASYLNEHYALTLSDEKVTRRQLLETLHDYSNHHYTRNVVETLNAYNYERQDHDNFIKNYKKIDASYRKSIMFVSSFVGLITLAVGALAFAAGSAGNGKVAVFFGTISLLMGVITGATFTCAKVAKPGTRDQRAKQAFDNHVDTSLQHFKGIEKSFEFDKGTKKLSMPLLTA